MGRPMLAYALCACQLMIGTAFLSSPKLATDFGRSTLSSSSLSRRGSERLTRIQLPGRTVQQPWGCTTVTLMVSHDSTPQQDEHREPIEQERSTLTGLSDLEPRTKTTDKSRTGRARSSGLPTVNPRFAALTTSALAAGLAVAVLAPGSAAAAAKAIVAGSEDEVHLHVGQKIANIFRRGGLPDWATLMTISAMPVVELRGGVPVGIWMGMPIAKVFGLCVAGNMIPIPIILLALRSSFVQKLAKPVLDRAREKAAGFGDEKSQALALTLFVGIPLPGTGAWTGAMGAFLLGMPFQKAILSIFVGVVSAGMIMSCLTLAGKVGALVATGILAVFCVSSIIGGGSGGNKASDFSSK